MLHIANLVQPPLTITTCLAIQEGMRCLGPSSSGSILSAGPGLLGKKHLGLGGPLVFRFSQQQKNFSEKHGRLVASKKNLAAMTTVTISSSKS